jgi:hypothetical protein
MADPGVVNPDNAADSVRTRVSDVLKAGLERDLTRKLQDDDAAVAGHASHIVSAKFEPGVLAQEDEEMLSSWDEERFEKFAERLSELRDASLPR